MKSAYFQTQVNQANRIKECYPCGSNCTVISGGCNCIIPTDLTLSTLTVNGKTTINGLIDPTGMEFTPVSANPGLIQANTIWVNSGDSDKLYYGASSIGSGGGWVGTAASNLNMNGYDITGGAGSLILSTVSNSTITLNSGGMAFLTLTDAAVASGDVSINTFGADSSINLSTEGNMFIYTQTMSSSISIGANNGTAQMLISDTGGAGTIDLTTSGVGNININSGSKVVMSCSDFEIPSNQSISTVSGTSVDMDVGSGAAHFTMAYNGTDGTASLTATTSVGISAGSMDFTTSSGGVIMDLNGSLEIKTDSNFKTEISQGVDIQSSRTDIQSNEYVLVNVASAVQLNMSSCGTASLTATDPSTGGGGFLTIDNAGVTLAASSGNCDITTPTDLVLNGTNLSSISAGGSSGNYLRIKLNGTYYKIALLQD
jgi:hypothetical protein